MGSRMEIEQSVIRILGTIGENVDREGLQDTPTRVAKMYEEIFSSVGLTDDQIKMQLSRTFTDEDSDTVSKFGDLVIVKDIPFYSTCEHHLVPFFGTASVGYIPNKKIIGISKIARLVDILAKRPQVQERITNDTARILEEMIDPLGVMVVIEARHLCMEMRGIKKPGAMTVTSCALKAFKQDPATRQEFLSLIK